MDMILGPLRMTVPDAFALEETKWVLRAPVQEELVDYRLQVGTKTKPIQVRPNLIVHRQTVVSGFNVQEHLARSVAELMQSVGGLKEIVRADIKFVDGVVGKVVIVAFAPTESVKLCQFHAYRLDDTTLTSLTWTMDARVFNPQKQEECIQMLSSMSLVSISS